MAWAPARTREGGGERQAAARGGRAAAWTSHPAEVARPRRLPQLCVREAADGLWVALCVGCAHPGAVRGTRVYAGAWAPFAPGAGFRRSQLAPRPQVSGYLCRWRGLGLAALDGWRTSRGRGKRRHRCSLGHFARGGERGRKGWRPSLYTVTVREA